MAQQQHAVIAEHIGEHRQFVDPQDLMCPGCGEHHVRSEPPGYWRGADGLSAPQFSHQDATALCRTRTGGVAEPIEAEHTGVV